MHCSFNCQKSNYGHFFINFVCCDISEKGGLIVFDTVIVYHGPADACKTAFGSVQNYSISFINIVIVVISERRMG